VIDIYSLAIGLAMGCFVGLALYPSPKGDGYRPTVERGHGKSPHGVPPFPRKK